MLRKQKYHNAQVGKVLLSKIKKISTNPLPSMAVLILI